MSLFIDTSIWYAAADRDDLDHASAARIVASGEQLVTTDHVIIESSRLIAHRTGRRSAEYFLEGILEGAADVEVVRYADLDHTPHRGIGAQAPTAAPPAPVSVRELATADISGEITGEFPSTRAS